MTNQQIQKTARRIIRNALKANKGILKPNLLKKYFFMNTEHSENAYSIWQKEVKLARLLLKKTRSVNKIIQKDWLNLAKKHKINGTYL